MFYNYFDSIKEPQNGRYFLNDENSFSLLDNLSADEGFFASVLNEKDKSQSFIQDNQKYFNKDIKDEIINPNIAEKQTNFKTEKNQLSKDDYILKTDINNKVEDSYKLYSFKDINKIFEKYGNFSDIIGKFKERKEFNYCLCNKKRKRENSKEIEKIDEQNIIYKEKKNTKRGRKCDGKSIREEHNKMSPDNIIKKIKSKIMLYLVEFMNKMIDKNGNEKNKFYKLNYKYINELKRNKNLQLLKMKIEELLSMEISPKNKKINSNFNQNLIMKIKNKKECVKDYETIIFVLNLTFEEWISLFTHKKIINEIILENELDSKDINIEKIQKSLNGADQLLRKMTKESDLFISYFIFFLYNYERWFFIKTGRSKNSKNE